MRHLLTALHREVTRLFDLVALVIHADARPPSPLDLRRRTARALGLQPTRRLPPR
jgi:hypothetical protein